MDSNDTYQPPPLEDILKTLSSLSSVPVNSQSATSTTFGLADAHRSSSEVATSYDPRIRPQSSTQQRWIPGTSKTPSVDPSCITSWPQALKYVMSVLSQNSMATSKIKSLIHSQHQHEKQWWAGRQNLILKQKGRDEGKKKADDLLRSLGSKRDVEAVPTQEQGVDGDEERKELEVYNAKVYRALSEMSRAIDTELRALGVPFFAIKHEMVTQVPTADNHTASGISNAGSAVLLSKDELLGLQKRMVQLLEDLFGE